jgi:hypothetical protein
MDELALAMVQLELELNIFKNYLYNITALTIDNFKAAINIIFAPYFE